MLDVIEEEQLEQHTLTVGNMLIEKLTVPSDQHELIGQVRGMGLLIGIELVTDRRIKRPAADMAAALVEELKARGILLCTDGPDCIVIRIKPPLVISEADVAHIVCERGRVLAST